MLSVELYVKIGPKRLCLTFLLIFAAIELIKSYEYSYQYEFFSYNDDDDKKNQLDAQNECLAEDEGLPVLHNKFTAKKLRNHMDSYIEYWTGCMLFF